MLPGSRPLLLAMFALAAVLAYLPTLRQPLLEDDYPNLAIAQTYGAPAAWRQLADSVYRLRATSEWLMKFAYDWFGMNPAPYYAVSILLHVLNTWLVYALGAWPPVGYRISAWAALFFAVYEGHQEAVMWFSACNELLQFLFGVGAVVCWLHFQQGGRRRWWWYGGMLAGLAMALVSKESAVVIAAMLVVTTYRSAGGRGFGAAAASGGGLRAVHLFHPGQFLSISGRQFLAARALLADLAGESGAPLLGLGTAGRRGGMDPASRHIVARACCGRESACCLIAFWSTPRAFPAGNCTWPAPGWR